MGTLSCINPCVRCHRDGGVHVGRIIFLSQSPALKPFDDIYTRMCGASVVHTWNLILCDGASVAVVFACSCLFHWLTVWRLNMELLQYQTCSLHLDSSFLLKDPFKAYVSGQQGSTTQTRSDLPALIPFVSRCVSLYLLQLKLSPFLPLLCGTLDPLSEMLIIAMRLASMLPKTHSHMHSADIIADDVCARCRFLDLSHLVTCLCV